MKWKLMILAGLTALSIFGCGNAEQGANDNTTDKSIVQEQTTSITAAEVPEDEFSFAEFKNLQFFFSSGAGGWSTSLTIAEDGTFSGEYSDSEMGVSGEDYPNGTRYVCVFSGQFTQPVKVNDYTYSMQIQEITYEKETGTEEILDGILYCYSDAYGLEEAENILIYIPGTPLAELSEEFRWWIGYQNLSDTTDTELPFYALNNEKHQYGFSSYSIIDSLRQMVEYTSETAASLEYSIQNDSLSQMEYNEKTQQLYELWDWMLNRVWDVLKQTQDAETMRALTDEELAWIALKEQEVASAGAEYEGGSIQPMVMNQKAAEMTEIRVYELMELFD